MKNKLLLLLMLGTTAGCPEWEYTPCFLVGGCEEEAGDTDDDIVYVAFEENVDYNSEEFCNFGADLPNLPSFKFGGLVDQMKADDFVNYGFIKYRTEETFPNTAAPFHFQDRDRTDPDHLLNQNLFDQEYTDFPEGAGAGVIGFAGYGNNGWLSYGFDPNYNDCDVDISYEAKLGDQDYPPYMQPASFDGKARYAFWLSSCAFYTPTQSDYPLSVISYALQGLTIQHGFYDHPDITSDDLVDFYNRLKNNAHARNLFAWENSMTESNANNNPAILFQAKLSEYEPLGGEPCVKAAADFREWNMIKKNQKIHKKMSEVHLDAYFDRCMDYLPYAGVYDSEDLYDDAIEQGPACVMDGPEPGAETGL